MNRLAWLEQVILGLNRRLRISSDTYWASIKLESDKMAELANGEEEGEIIPVPDFLKPEGNKHREPLSAAASSTNMA